MDKDKIQEFRNIDSEIQTQRELKDRVTTYIKYIEKGVKGAYPYSNTGMNCALIFSNRKEILKILQDKKEIIERNIKELQNELENL
jgi:chaperonin cofactor prefoldin